MLEFKRYKSVIGKNIIFKEVQVSDASFILSRVMNLYAQLLIILPYLSGFIFRTIILDQICN